MGKMGSGRAGEERGRPSDGVLGGGVVEACAAEGGGARHEKQYVTCYLRYGPDCVILSESDIQNSGRRATRTAVAEVLR
jgi:hypothetical protein